MHQYANGVPPANYDSMADFQEKTTKELASQNVKANPAIFQIMWLIKNRVITQKEARKLYRAGK